MDVETNHSRDGTSSRNEQTEGTAGTVREGQGTSMNRGDVVREGFLEDRNGILREEDTGTVMPGFNWGLGQGREGNIQ